MSQLVLSRGRGYRKSIIKKIFPNFEPGFGFLVVSLVLFVGLITVITLMFSARQVTKGYVLNSLKAQNEDLVKELEIQDMEISKVRSLSTLENSSQVRAMMRPRAVTYIDGETAIASK